MTATLHAFRDSAVPASELAATSDALDPAQRVEAIRALTARDLARLWEIAEELTAAVALDFLLAPDVTPGHTAEWIGKNSLPMFSHFTKRFTRGEAAGTLVGQNTGAMEWLTGPGYFIATVRPETPSELLIDYTRVPTAPPPGWPKVRPNESGISRLVFGNMHDYLRPIGEHLAIGAAFTTAGKFRGQYFALARGPVLPIGN
jgi:hypothetical protein